MWSVRSKPDGESKSTRRKYMWDKTQHGGGSWWSSGFRDSLDGSVASHSRCSQLVTGAEWNLEGSVFNENLSQEKQAVKSWLAGDSSRGIIRIYEARINTTHSTVVLCSLTTTAQQICLKVGLPPNALHYQLNGDVIKRMDPFDFPLVLQNEYLKCIGFDKINRIQEEGASADLVDFIKYYAGKPYLDATFSRQTLCSVLMVRKQKGLLHPWVRRLCEISGTRLLLYPASDKNQSPEILYLIRGRVEEARGQRNHEFCLKVTGFTTNATTITTSNGGAPPAQTSKTLYLAFESENELMKWSRKCNKAITKQPDVADLSNNHLEFLPENLFINNENLTKLNLRHNALKERPIEEDIYTIGWIDDLPRFSLLRSLNLAHNDLRSFPLAVCKIRTLVELNMANNKLDDLPGQIADLINLKAMHLEANHLKDLPAEMRHMKELKLLVLAFNHFTSVPAVIADMKQMESLILAGNFITHIPDVTVANLKHIHKLDLRMNRLELPQELPTSWNALLNITHIDLRDNRIPFLDLRGLMSLQFLNCQRNQTSLVYLSGGALCYLNLSKNCLQKVCISPIPANLLHLDLSHNSLTSLPDWIGELRRMETLLCSFNHLTSLPNRLFQNICSLKMLVLDHNRLTMLPDKFAVKCQLETLLMHQNKLTYLPDRFLSTCNRLRILNVSNNRLFSLPAPSTFTDHNRIQEMYLAANHLQDDALEIVAQYPRLKVLNLAYNDIHCVSESFFCALELIEELNLSGNKLSQLPDSMRQLAHLQVLKLHSNKLRMLPDFSGCVSLRVLDIGANELEQIPLGSMMGQNLKHLDVSFNKHLRIDHKQFTDISSDKQVTLVDMKDGLSNALEQAIPQAVKLEESDQATRWKVGFAQTSGNRNKLCITQLRICGFDGCENQAVFGLFDGGFNNEVPVILSENFPTILSNERKSHPASSSSQCLKFSLLKAHIATGSTGQKTGAAAVVCHANQDSDGRMWLHVANVGHAEAVLSRAGQPVLLSRNFLTTADAEEYERIRSVDGLITEDSLVNGSCTATRMIGCSYLFPAIIPEPHCTSVKLCEEDEFIVMANRAVWDVMTHKEVVNEIRGLPNMIIAAKKLVDLAQSYGARGNLSVIVASCDPAENSHLRYHSEHASEDDEVLPNESSTKSSLEATEEDESDEDFFAEDMPQGPDIRKSFNCPRSASQILIMDEQVCVSRSAHSLTSAVEPDENYYFRHRRESLADALSSGSTSPETSCEKTVLTNGDDFEVHVSSSNARDSDLSGNTLSGHGDSALGSSVNPSVSDGNGSPISHDGCRVNASDNGLNGTTFHCEVEAKNHDDDTDAIHLSDPMDEECRSWQFLMNEAIGNVPEDDQDEGVEDSTLTPQETAVVNIIIKESPVSTDESEAHIPRPPTPPLPPDPSLFFKPPSKFRITPGRKPVVVEEEDPKRSKPLIDELESVLKKRLTQMEEGIQEEAANNEAAAGHSGDDNLMKRVKSSYQLKFRLSSQPAFIAHNNSKPESLIRRKF